MGFGFFGERVVAVVGGDDGDVEFAADIGDGGVEAGELGVAVVLDFEVVVAVEDFAVVAGGGDGAFAVAFLDAAVELGGGAAAEDGDAGGVFFDEFAVDAGFVVVAFEVGPGDEGDEVFVSGHVPGEHDEVVGGAIAAFAGEAGAGGDVGLDADDGLDAAGGGFAVEIDRAVEGAVVGHGDGFLA